ncbi:phytoene dehydrogenase [Aspergillus sclerotiicarbonarius CBS 121057]|uniref:Phytoene desaturase n=1 Tax=Aspergillus sclerotiicarbonarius (strain CBS 121057 / IBT 28362) TaxID=1448318 RepID=A0A319FLR3_ASPSB|nr:phytoene dehydrogenase [Aspergillus sclerotiicarbonarius CBS 121057]
MESPTAIVVGAGVGGVAVAARLAKKGYRVTVVEKNGEIGGRCSLLHDNGYRFDQGPSLLLMPSFFHQIFHDLGTTMSAEGITLQKCTPNYRIWFPDHDTLDLSTDLSSMKSQIEAHEGPHGFEGFLRFLIESGRHHNLSCEHVLHQNFPSIWSMLRLDLLLALPQLHPFESIYTRVSRYFHSEKLRQAFTFASMYLGMSPFDAPATYSLLQYSELADGIWYPIGGFRTILDALARISTRHNATYIMNTPVTSIELTPDQKSVTGVRLFTGALFTADIVIVNADLTYAYNNLLPPAPYSKSLQRRATSCSTISFYWSLDTTVPALQAHNVFLAREYRNSFDAIFQHNHIPEEPSFYVHVPSRIDPSASPPDRDAVIVLVPVGHLPDPDPSTPSPSPSPSSSSSYKPTSTKPQPQPQPQSKSEPSPPTENKSWETITTQTRTQILHIIHTQTNVNLSAHITHEKIETPFTWKEKYNLDRGAILGLSHSFTNVMGFRPGIQHRGIGGLFFVGASTHPGTGVPVVLGGSGITADAVGGYIENVKEVGGRRGGKSVMWWGGGLGWMMMLLVVVVVVVMKRLGFGWEDWAWGDVRKVVDEM